MSYEAIIGLEVHAQLLTESKIFCGCSSKFGALPNSHVCPVCMGMPGVLPVLNKKAVEFAIKMALATNCRINSYSVCARKNYFYPDLPKGYQISQYEHPLANDGWVEIEVNNKKKRIGIIRIHMEEDAGKLIHDPYKPLSYVDFNRTGVPLIEIVSKPEIHSPEEGVAYLKKLHDILRYLEICDGNMEEGSFRCDANISLRLIGSLKFGVRTELKNMNSFRHVQRALAYEIERQRNILDQGEEIIQETRLWDETKGITRSMRGKEEAHDYRYFPDPDLVPVEVDEVWLKEIKKTLCELPDAKKERFIKIYGLPPYDAQVLTSTKQLADYFEVVVKHGGEPKLASNWIMSELLGKLNQEKKDIIECSLLPEYLAELLQLIERGTISGKIAKAIFEEMYATGNPPTSIVEEKGLVQITDETALEEIGKSIIKQYPKEVAQYRRGKEKLFGFFVGQMMKQTKGKANPQMANKIFKRLLER